MTFHVLTLSLLLIFFQLNAAKETIEIINNTNNAIHVAHPVPTHIKATISFTQIEQAATDEYLIIALPENFLSIDDGHSLNNRGQIAGFIRDKTMLVPKSDPRTRWKSPLKMPSEKGYGCHAAVWSLADGLIVSDLNNTRAIALNDQGFVAVSKERDLPDPDILWNINTNDFESQAKMQVHHGSTHQILWHKKEKIKVEAYRLGGGDVGGYILDSNELGSQLIVRHDPFNTNNKPETFLFNSGKYRVVKFQSELDVNKTRMRTGLPIVNLRLNDMDNVVAIVNINGKQAIGSWSKTKGSTVTGCLQDNPHFKDYTNFAIAGFNNHGQILIRADIGNPNQLEYLPIKPRMFLLAPA